MAVGIKSNKRFAQETGNIKANGGLLVSLASTIRTMKLSRNVPECHHVREKIQVWGIVTVGLSHVLGFEMTSGRSSIVSWHNGQSNGGVSWKSGVEADLILR